MKEFPFDVRLKTVNKKIPSLSQIYWYSDSFCDFFNHKDLIQLAKGKIKTYGNSNLFCIYEETTSYIQELRHRLMFVRSSKVKQQIARTDWDLTDSAIKLFKTSSKRNFLPSAIKEFLDVETEIDISGGLDSAYIDRNEKVIAVKRVSNSTVKKRTSIYIALEELVRFMKHRKLSAICSLESHRYSERFLGELALNEDICNIEETAEYHYDLDFHCGENWRHDERPLMRSTAHLAFKSDLTKKLTIALSKFATTKPFSNHEEQ